MPVSESNGPQDFKKKAKKAKKPTTSARAWKRANAETDLELPSGNVCRVRRPGLDAMITEGIIPDTLLSIAQDAVDTGRGTGKSVKKIEGAQLKELMSDPKKWAGMIDTIDRACVYIVIEPDLKYHRQEIQRPIDGDGNLVGEICFETISLEDRDPDLLYTDEVDLEDKFHIFDFACGGSRDLERFRQKHERSVAGLLDVEEV
jgi:hypothetical protein